MCGIVGILGRAPVAELLVDSLKRLEYRGYDSAGVATLEGKKLDRRRAEGKLRNLEAKLEARPLGGHTGIGRLTQKPAIFAANQHCQTLKLRNPRPKPLTVRCRDARARPF